MKNLMKQIKGNGRRALTLGGLVASSMWLLGNTGCQTLSPQGDAFMAGLGQAALYTYATESVKAQVNPAQTNVYVNEGQNRVSEQVVTHVQQRALTQEEEIIKRFDSGEQVFFTCNYEYDFNKNGKTGSDEFVNIKKNFKTNEKITIIATINMDLNNKILKNEILNNNGDLVKMEKMVIDYKVNEKRMLNYLVISPGELQNGYYTSIFSVNDKYIGKAEFNVE